MNCIAWFCRFRLLASLGGSVILILSASPSIAQNSVSINLASSSPTGQRIPGESTVTLLGLNILRYSISVTVATTSFAAATPQPGSVLALAGNPTTSVPSASPGTRTGGKEEVTAKGCPACPNIKRDLGQLQTFNTQIEAAIAAVNVAAGGASSVAYALDAVLANDKVSDYAGEIDRYVAANVSPVADKVRNHVNDVWPDALISQYSELSPTVASEIERCPGLKPKEKPTPDATRQCAQYKALYDYTILRFTNATSTASRKTFDANISLLSALNGPLGIVVSLKSAAFERKIDVRCSPSLDSSTSTDVSVTRVDRLASDPSKSTENLKVATIVCTSPITFSGGLVYTNIHDQQVTLVPVPGSTPAMNRVAASNNQSGQTSIIVLTNGRLAGNGEGWNFDLSAGVIVNGSSSTTQSATNFTLGPTLSYNERLFLTAGYYFGKTQQLLPGYSNGQLLPVTSTIPPVGPVSSAGWGIALTFRP